jgi:DNA mismatch endonuclease, patch repair protein
VRRQSISRSENMRRIRSKDTSPELTVRHHLRILGYKGYRLHRKDLPGRPDVVFMGRRKAILVHGCFWHGHICNEGRRQPKSNSEYWIAKIAANREREHKNNRLLVDRGWDVLTLWECEIEVRDKLETRIAAFMAEKSSVLMAPAILR